LVILQKRVAGLSEATLARFVLRARRAVGLRGSVHVLVTSSTAIRGLNRQFRLRNKATDVLSFPSVATSAKSTSGKSSSRISPAGDVAISADIALQNAIRLGHSPAEEVKILTLHGILHLAGFDHERDNGAMARKEAKLRVILGLPTALIERTESGSKPPNASPKRRRPV
jgi:probable rRNA maturation factor